MTILEKITRYYGDVMDETSAEYLQKKTRNFSEGKINVFFETLCETHPKKYGAPDVACISKVLEKAFHLYQNEKKYNSYCKKCNKCSALYSYGMDFCPVCYKSGIKYGRSMDEYTIKGICEEDCDKVIKYNIGHAYEKNEKSCYDCYVSNKFCSRFYYNKAVYKCPEHDFCPCSKCCDEAGRIISSERS